MPPWPGFSSAVLQRHGQRTLARPPSTVVDGVYRFCRAERPGCFLTRSGSTSAPCPYLQLSLCCANLWLSNTTPAQR
jgi:hypothetical protein